MVVALAFAGAIAFGLLAFSKFAGVDFKTGAFVVVCLITVTLIAGALLFQGVHPLSLKNVSPGYVSLVIAACLPLLNFWSDFGFGGQASEFELLVREPKWYGLWYMQALMVAAPSGLYAIPWWRGRAY
jgi:hypothetical protein